MRDDEEARAELHQRVDDLHEDLYKISFEKKQDSERERESIKSKEWVSDKIGLLINHYITLMQVNIIIIQYTLSNRCK
jgi:hypothetical protein